jgi:hypothetical protein
MAGLSEVFWARAAGVVVLLALGLLLWLVRGRRWTLGALFEGDDRRPSTSKFQFCVWTVVVLYAYVGLAAARWFRGHPGFVGEVPPNLLIAMGLSAGTALGAKAITAYKVRTGREAKRHAPGAPPAGAAPGPRRATGLGFLVTDDEGAPSLGKTQLLAWTFVAAGTYLLLIWTHIGEVMTTLTPGADCTAVPPPAPCAAAALPEIDGALMALMGLGQGAYLGAKLVPDAPLQPAVPASAAEPPVPGPFVSPPAPAGVGSEAQRDDGRAGAGGNGPARQ